MISDNEKHIFIETIKQISNPSDLEKDIIDTIEEVSKQSLDFNQANARIASNYLKHNELYLKVCSMPNTVSKSPNQINEMDLRYILKTQLDFLLEKEFKEKYSE